MDFFAITDHNTWTFPEFADSPNVMVIAGVEVTMEYGHFNVFSETGTEPEWLKGLPQPWAVRDEETPPGASQSLIEAVKASGLRMSINHPLSYPWEWLDSRTSISDARYLEIWNDPTWPENRLTNPAAVQMWTRWLNAGSRATAIGGSDFHTPEAAERFDGRVVPGHRVGWPRTYVLAEANDPASVLEAVDARRAYVTMGPTVELSARAADAEQGIGGDLSVVDGAVDFEASTSGVGWLALEMVKNGNVVAGAAGNGSTGLTLKQRIGGERIRVDSRRRTHPVR